MWITYRPSHPYSPLNLWDTESLPENHISTESMITDYLRVSAIGMYPGGGSLFGSKNLLKPQEPQSLP